jgi:hypothetical protein
MVKVLIYFLILLTFSTPVLIRHMWKLETIALLHRCLIYALLLSSADQPRQVLKQAGLQRHLYSANIFNKCVN